MGMSEIVARGVALVGATAIRLREHTASGPQAFGARPAIPAARPQGAIPTLKMPTARGWPAGRTPVAAPGLEVNAFATGLKHPRWIHVLPNGDVLTAESLTLPGESRSVFDIAINATMKRAAAQGPSPNRIILLRDADGDGVAETRETYLENLRQPFGMALVGDTFYVGNTDGLVAFPFEPGATRLAGPGKRLAEFKPGGHWTRSLLAERRRLEDLRRRRLAQQHRRRRHGGGGGPRLHLGVRRRRRHRPHLRRRPAQPGRPRLGARARDALWTVVNERDGLGDETPPDYLTSVRDGGFYGWPWCYWGRTVDDRVPQDPALVATALTARLRPRRPHRLPRPLLAPAGTLPGFPDGMVIGQHGSWNRSILSGYKVILIPFENGKPAGPARDILTGFLSADETASYGRPVGVTIGPDGSLLVADDVGDVIWRVTGA